MRYRSITVTRRGGLEAVAVVEHPLHSPGPGEALVRVLTAPVCQDDVAIRRGNRPFLRRPPFVPGYAFIGEVAAVGPGAGPASAGDRVTALTRFDSHAEYIRWPTAELAPVPTDVDPVAAATIPLNYLVAHQVLHRVARVRPGRTALVIGASGGVGTAFLDLARLAGLRSYGTASPTKHQVVRDLGATPIDYHDTDLVATLRHAEPAGLDYVFNGMGPEYLAPGLALLRRGGRLVAYGAPRSMPDLLRLLGRLVLTNTLPNGKTITGYGTHRQGVETFKQDWATLFGLLREGHLHPVVTATYRLQEATRAYQALEEGRVVGNIVLVVDPEQATHRTSAG
jgi:NADPH:quinone reductase-like Zn-dependent oxidoreductase